MKDGGGGEDPGGEARGDDDGVVEGGLVGGEEHGVGLAEVHVEGRVGGLHGVGALHLDELHGVALEPDVEGGGQAHVGNPEAVRLACSMRSVFREDSDLQCSSAGRPVGSKPNPAAKFRVLLVPRSIDEGGWLGLPGCTVKV